MEGIEEGLTVIETVSSKCIEKVFLELLTIPTVGGYFDAVELTLDGLLEWIEKSLCFEGLFGDESCALL